MNSFKENLKEFLLNNIPGKVVAGDKEFLCRCPYCGDSRNLKSAHFYINLPNSDETPVMYHCYDQFHNQYSKDWLTLLLLKHPK